MKTFLGGNSGCNGLHGIKEDKRELEFLHPIPACLPYILFLYYYAAKLLYEQSPSSDLIDLSTSS